MSYFENVPKSVVTACEFDGKGDIQQKIKEITDLRNQYQKKNAAIKTSFIELIEKCCVQGIAKCFYESPVKLIIDCTISANIIVDIGIVKEDNSKFIHVAYNKEKWTIESIFMSPDRCLVCNQVETATFQILAEISKDIMIENNFGIDKEKLKEIFENRITITYIQNSLMRANTFKLEKKRFKENSVGVIKNTIGKKAIDDVKKILNDESKDNLVKLEEVKEIEDGFYFQFTKQRNKVLKVLEHEIMSYVYEKDIDEDCWIDASFADYVKYPCRISITGMKRESYSVKTLWTFQIDFTDKDHWITNNFGETLEDIESDVLSHRFLSKVGDYLFDELNKKGKLMYQSQEINDICYCNFVITKIGIMCAKYGRYN